MSTVPARVPSTTAEVCRAAESLRVENGTGGDGALWRADSGDPVPSAQVTGHRFVGQHRGAGPAGQPEQVRRGEHRLYLHVLGVQVAAGEVAGEVRFVLA